MRFIKTSHPEPSYFLTSIVRTETAWNFQKF
jgi:hypothetical protein